MCGRIALYSPPPRLARYFAAREAAEVRAAVGAAANEPSWNVAPGRPVLIVTAHHDRDPEHPEAAAPLVRVLQAAQWGLVPFWAKDPAIGQRMINARAEQLTTKPAFRGAFDRRRCVVPADGFFEWQRVSRERRPWYYQRADGEPLGLAGLWETWRPHRDSGAEVVDHREQVLVTCTIITTDAGPDVAEVHDRMPVIIEPGDIDEWLGLDPVDETALADLLRSSPAGTLRSHRVDPRMNRPDEDDARVIEPLDTARRSEQLGLFDPAS